jgi:hypothetical protein
MYHTTEATKERVAAYAAALEDEIAGYEARIKRIESARMDPLLLDGRIDAKEAAAQIQDRIKQCRAELARVRKAKTAPAED